jgi:NADH-quinone oxidoreductase subunit J
VELTFYACALVSVLCALRVVTHSNPVHALLYLVVMLLAFAGVFFAIGAPFAGALQVILYAGAIMVLFVFVVMMLNLGPQTEAQERQWLRPSAWVGPVLLAAIVLAALVRSMLGADAPVGATMVDSKQVGIALFGPYLLAVELASLLLLGALVAAWHLGRDDAR